MFPTLCAVSVFMMFSLRALFYARSLHGSYSRCAETCASSFSEIFNLAASRNFNPVDGGVFYHHGELHNDTASGIGPLQQNCFTIALWVSLGGNKC
jgi:hypothetical protein